MKEEIKLRIPIEVKDGDNINTIETVFMDKRLKAKHLRMIPQEILNKMQDKENNFFGLNDALVLIRILTGLTEAEADELDYEDITNLAEVMSGFLGQTP